MSEPCPNCKTQLANSWTKCGVCGYDRPPKETIIQVAITGVDNTVATQCDFIVIALTSRSRVIVNHNGRDEWFDITPKLLD